MTLLIIAICIGVALVALTALAVWWDLRGTEEDGDD